jgi:hypothetical protein
MKYKRPLQNPKIPTDIRSVRIWNEAPKGLLQSRTQFAITTGFIKAFISKVSEPKCLVIFKVSFTLNQ